MFHLEEWEFLLLNWSKTGRYFATRVDFSRDLGLEGGVGPALGLIAVGSTNKEMFGISLGQHSDVILALVLKEVNKVITFCFKSISFTSNFHLFMAQRFHYHLFLWHHTGLNRK